MDANYTRGLVYNCMKSNYYAAYCDTVHIDVIARSHDLLKEDMADCLSHVNDLCIHPSELVAISHEGRHILLLSLY